MPQIAHKSAGNATRGVWLATFADEKSFMKKAWCFPDHHRSDSPQFILLFPTDHGHCTETDVKPRDQLGMMVNYKKRQEKKLYLFDSTAKCAFVPFCVKNCVIWCFS